MKDNNLYTILYGPYTIPFSTTQCMTVMTVIKMQGIISIVQKTKTPHFLYNFFDLVQCAVTTPTRSLNWMLQCQLCVYLEQSDLLTYLLEDAQILK